MSCATYKAAVAKTADMPIFFLSVICSWNTQTIGRSRRVRSEMELMTLVTMLTVFIFTQ